MKFRRTRKTLVNDICQNGTHTWHLEHDTERRLNKDASCVILWCKDLQGKNKKELFPLKKKEKKRISEAFFETLSLQISTALSFRVLPAHAPDQGNGKRKGIQHRAFCSRASLCIPACCCYGYRWRLRSYRPVFLVPLWFRLSVLVCASRRFRGVNEPLTMLWDCV